jgi:hypothetical protein
MPFRAAVLAVTRKLFAILFASIPLTAAAQMPVDSEVVAPDTAESRPSFSTAPQQAIVSEPAAEALPPPDSLPAARAPRRGMQPMGNDRSPVRFSGTWMPGRQVEGQASDLAITGFQANLAAPLRISPDGRRIWLATSNFEYLQFDTTAVLPDSLIDVPQVLWKFNLGTMHLREFDNGWSGGGMLSVGTASDRPFADLREMTMTSLAFLNVPRGERDAWNFSLFYSPTSQLPFPIPGAAYVWRPSDRFSANLGVPFSLRYQPTDEWTFAADYRPLTAVNLQARRSLGSAWNLYARYEVVNETYWLAERTNSQDRLYLFDQRAALGLDRQLASGFSLDLSTAYVFDRKIFQAESFSGSRSDVIDIAPGPALSLMLRWSR